MTLKEVSVSLNVSLDRVYYIFRKLNLKTQCKKDGGKWVVEGELLLWKIRRENYLIDDRKFKRRQKAYAKIHEYADALVKEIQIQEIRNAYLKCNIDLLTGGY
jgi:hypothetical protein